MPVEPTSVNETDLVSVGYFDGRGGFVKGQVTFGEFLDSIDPPRTLDDDFRRELLGLCYETDEAVAKVGMARFHTFLRADLETLIETLRDRPVSLEDAKQVANEYLSRRDAKPPDVGASEEPTAEDIAAWDAHARARGLLTPREAIARWSQEHPDNPIAIDDLDAEDIANFDVRTCYPIGQAPKGRDAR